MTLKAENVKLCYGSRTVIEDLNLTLNEGEITALIGPNGCGKSTLLHALAGINAVDGGRVLLDDAPISRIPRRQIAQRLSFLPQNPDTPSDITVRQLIRQGRFVHHGLWKGFNQSDYDAVDAAIEATNLGRKAEEELTTVSGGEKQRAWIATALAQQSDILILDEPTSFLDIGHQVEVLELLFELVKKRGKTAVLAIHDIGQALALADRIIVMQRGEVKFDGNPSTLAQRDIINKVFEIKGTFLNDNASQLPLFFAQMNLQQREKLKVANAEGRIGPRRSESYAATAN
uniref:RC198 n=1 Tax=Ruegeria sp. PR1b TaxID=185588 RepID=Q8KVZ2_9RHOB|nr:ABC transporter ATP-binding protein [Ruegeria sp. PR1b]AAN05271.1 RC198 [Ruegeria sp. PR1b]